MQALEELAVSYDTKDREIDSIATEKQLLLEEVEGLQVRAAHPSHPHNTPSHMVTLHTYTHSHTLKVGFIWYSIIQTYSMYHLCSK